MKFFNWIFRPSVQVRSRCGEIDKLSRIRMRGNKLVAADASRNAKADVTVIPMAEQIFRVVDIPALEKDVLAAQLHNFFPLIGDFSAWTLLSVAERSFIMIWPESSTAGHDDNGRQGYVIPAITAAILHFLWYHGNDGELALPIDAGYLYVDIIAGKPIRIDLRTKLSDDTIIYGNDDEIACGAALFMMLPQNLCRDFRARKPLSIMAKRFTALVTIISLAVVLWGYSTYIRDTARLAGINAAIRNIRQQSKQVDAIVIRNKKIADTAKLIVKINDEYISPYLILADISRYLPEQAFLAEIFIDGATGYISGSSKDAASLLQKMSARPYMKKTEFSTSTTRDAEGNEHFQISFQVNKANHGP